MSPSLNPLREALDKLEATAKDAFGKVETSAETVAQEDVDKLVARVQTLEQQIAGAKTSAPAAAAPATGGSSASEDDASTGSAGVTGTGATPPAAVPPQSAGAGPSTGTGATADHAGSDLGL